MNNPITQQIIATFIGAFAAFAFSLILFDLTERIKSKKSRKDLSININKELDYNLSFLRKYKDEFDSVLRKISAGDKNIYLKIRFSRLQRLFILEAFSKGMLYEFLNDDDLTDLEDLLNHAVPWADQWALETINKFSTGQSTQIEALGAFEFEKSNIEKYIKILENIKTKLRNFK